MIVPKYVAIVDSCGVSGSTEPLVSLVELIRERGYEVALHSPVSDQMFNYLENRGVRVIRARRWTRGPIKSTLLRRAVTPMVWSELVVSACKLADVVIAWDTQGLLPSALVKMLRPKVLLVSYFQDLYLPAGYRRSFYLQTARSAARYVDLSLQHNPYHVAVRREVFGLKCPAHCMIEGPSTSVPRPSDWSPSHSGPLQLVYQGTIASYTGIPELITAVESCGDDVELRVMGHMPVSVVEQEGYLSRFQAVKSIEFLGWLSTEEMMRHTSRGDVGVVLRPHRIPDVTLNWIFPGSQKIYQYMACGLPILASDNPTFRFVEDEGIGICVQAERPDSIASAIRRFNCSAQMRIEMGERAQKLFVEKYNRRTQMKSFLNALVAACPP